MPAVAAASSEVEASNHNRLVSLQRRSLLALHSTPLRGLLSCSRQHGRILKLWIGSAEGLNPNTRAKRCLRIERKAVRG